MPSSELLPKTPASPRTVASHLALEYLGFRNGPGRREYLLRAQSGALAREYTVLIADAAFARRQALLQDGPDICYQKLRRALAEADLTGDACLGVTEGDLADYRETHAPRPRQSPRPRPAIETTHDERRKASK